jgi:hypothetical protein
MHSEMPRRNVGSGRSVFVVFAVCSLLLTPCTITLARAQTVDLVRMPVNPANRVSLTGSSSGVGECSERRWRGSRRPLD